MADQKIQVTLTARDLMSGQMKAATDALQALGIEVETVDEGIDDLDRRNDTLGESWTEIKSKIDLATQGFQMFAQAAYQAYEAAEQGAVIRQTTDNFDALGLSIEDLRASTNGTVDDMTLMSGSLTLVAGASGELSRAYTDAIPDLLQMAKAASKLNPRLGNTQTLFQDLTVAAKRQSAQIADNLGITVKQGEAYENYARSVGKSVDELTNQEKQLAFLNELLDAGNTLLEQAGGNTDAATDGYGRLRANVSNLTAALQEQADVGLRPVVNWLAEVTDHLVEAQDHTAEISETFGTGAAIAMRYGGTLSELDGPLRQVQAAYALGAGQMRDYAAMERQAAAEAERLSWRLGELGASGQMYATNAQAQAEASHRIAEAHRNAAEAALDQASNTTTLAGNLKDATSQQIASQLIGMLDPKKMGADAYGEAVKEIGVSFGVMDEKSFALAENMGGLAEAIESGVIPTQDMDTALQDFIEDAEDGEVNMEGIIDKFDGLEDVAFRGGEAMGRTGRAMMEMGEYGPDAAKQVGEIGTQFGNGAPAVGAFAGHLETTDEKLAKLVRGSPWTISVVADDEGGPGTPNPGPRSPSFPDGALGATPGFTSGGGVVIQNMNVYANGTGDVGDAVYRDLSAKLKLLRA
jgi:hypothetical protein